MEDFVRLNHKIRALVKCILETRSTNMPSGHKIDWSQYDDLIKNNLPSLTVAAFQRRFLPSINAHVIGARAKKLGVKPAPKTLTVEQKTYLSNLVSKAFTNEQVEYIRKFANRKPRTEIAEELGLTHYLITKIGNENGVVWDSEAAATMQKEKNRSHLPRAVILKSDTRIDWSQYDDALRGHLPNMTIEAWCKSFAPHISSKAIGKRARKLGVRPSAYKMTMEHRVKLSDSLTQERTLELVAKIRELRDLHSLHKLAEMLNISTWLLTNLIKRYDIKLSPAGYARAREADRQASLNKVPWNKGGHLSEETKRLISIATTGELNGQYERGMTEVEKERWREAYFANGIYRAREWIKSPAGKATLARALVSTTSPEYRSKMSKICTELYKSGKLSCSFRSSRLSTVKGGDFTTKSSYETRYVEILEADEEVVAFKYEPFSIEYEFEGATLNYTPDFLVLYLDGHEELAEVKPERMVSLPKNEAKFEAAESYHPCFRIITEKELGI